MARLIVAAMVVLLCSGPIWAGVQYIETSDFKLSGPLGTLVNVMAKLGGTSTKMVRKVYIEGDLMRTDEGEKRSMLTDIGKLQTVHINHEEQTYTVVPFGILRHAFDQKVTLGSEQMSQQTTVEAEEGEVEVEVDFDFEVERTGKTKKIEGNKAEQVYSTVKVNFKGEGRPTDLKSEEPAGDLNVEGGATEERSEEVQQFEGTIVVDSQLWMSQKVKGYEEVKDFHLRLAKAYAGELGFTQDRAEGMREALMSDPRIGEGLEKAAEEARKLAGVELANTTWVVVVPANLEYNSAKVRGKKKKKKSGFGSFAKGLAKKAAESKMGLEGEEVGEAEEKPPEQTTIITMTKKMGKFKTKALKDGLFEIPANYTEVKQPVLENSTTQ